MAITLKFHGEAFKRELRKATAVGLQRAAVFLYNKCVQAVNKSNTHRRKVKYTPAQSARRGGQKTGTKYLNMENKYENLPPFKRTGAGQSNIVWEFNGSYIDPRVRVGVRKNALYMIYLELGTRRIKARPWLLAMMKRYEKQLERLALSGFKKK